MEEPESSPPENESDESDETPEPAYFAAAVEWLNDRWGKPPLCPYCGISHTWQIGPPIKIQGTREDLFVPFIISAFTVSCRHCGHTIFINRDAAHGDVHEDSE